MNKTLKWILYILLGLAGIALLLSGIYVIFGRMGFGMMGARGLPFNGHMGFNFNPIRLFFGAILCLGVFLLFVLGIVALVTAIVRGNRPAITPAPVAPAVPGAPVAPVEHPCSNCGRMTQEDWKTCPYCGNPLT